MGFIHVNVLFFPPSYARDYGSGNFSNSDIFKCNLNMLLLNKDYMKHIFNICEVGQEISKSLLKCGGGYFAEILKLEMSLTQQKSNSRSLNILPNFNNSYVLNTIRKGLASGALTLPSTET